MNRFDTRTLELKLERLEKENARLTIDVEAQTTDLRVLCKANGEFAEENFRMKAELADAEQRYNTLDLRCAVAEQKAKDRQTTIDYLRQGSKVDSKLLADAVAPMQDYHAGRELTDIELVEQAVEGAIQGIDDHFKVEALRTAMRDAMGRRDTPICFNRRGEILPDGKTAHYKEIVQALESAGRKCFERGGNVWHDNPYPHGGDNHAHWFVGFAEAKQKANPEPADEPAEESR